MNKCRHKEPLMLFNFLGVVISEVEESTVESESDEEDDSEEQEEAGREDANSVCEDEKKKEHLGMVTRSRSKATIFRSKFCKSLNFLKRSFSLLDTFLKIDCNVVKLPVD